MQPVKFDEVNLTYAEDQPEYMPLPAYRKNDKQGTAVFCWELTDEELEILIKTKRIWHQIWTFNQPLQPQLLMVEKPNMGASTTCVKCSTPIPENEFVCPECQNAHPN